jgi:hypothetical protein
MSILFVFPRLLLACLLRQRKMPQHRLRSRCYDSVLSFFVLASTRCPAKQTDLHLFLLSCPWSGDREPQKRNVIWVGGRSLPVADFEHHTGYWIKCFIQVHVRFRLAFWQQTRYCNAISVCAGLIGSVCLWRALKRLLCCLSVPRRVLDMARPDAQNPAEIWKIWKIWSLGWNAISFLLILCARQIFRIVQISQKRTKLSTRGRQRGRGG